MSSERWYSPQLSQVSAGTFLMTTVVSPRCSTTVVVPGAVSPCLQMTQVMVISSCGGLGSAQSRRQQVAQHGHGEAGDAPEGGIVGDDEGGARGEGRRGVDGA